MTFPQIINSFKKLSALKKWKHRWLPKSITSFQSIRIPKYNSPMLSKFQI